MWTTAARGRPSRAPVGLAAVLLLLLAPWQQQQQPQRRLAAGQGLGVPTELLGAGEAATASQFGLFEDILSGLVDTTGGGRGSSKGRTGSSLASDPKSFSSLQLSIYSIAGAPLVYNSFNRSQTRGGASYQPAVRDQGKCDSCVAQSIAEAMEASVAATLQQDASKWRVSAPTMYYCSQGSRSCKTGWDIQEALVQMADQAPTLVRPYTCAPPQLQTVSLEPEISSWAPICADALSKPCPEIVPSQPQWLKCSFRSLSTFAQIQSAIRTYGSVVTRISIYNDFAQFFSGNNTRGFASRVYKVGPRARSLFGHAVIITGYSNTGSSLEPDSYSWTIQNSWGCTGAGCPASNDGVRKAGVTDDGLFRIRMGDAGVGTPDQTFAVMCEPAPGSERDPHGAKAWRVRTDMPLSLTRVSDINNLSQGVCFLYRARSTDHPAAIADAFEIDIRQLAADNTHVFPTISGNTVVRNAMTAQQMANIVREVMAATPAPGSIQPYFRCRTYDGPRIGRPVECRGSSASSFAPCAGLSPCTLFFPQQDLAVGIQGKELRICNVSGLVPADRPEDRVVPYFSDAAVRQGRALKALLQAIAPARGSTTRNLKDVSVPLTLKEQCDGGWLPEFAGAIAGSVGFKGRLVIGCNKANQVSFLSIGLVSFASAGSSAQVRRESHQLLTALRSFTALSELVIIIADGELPPQLGALSSKLRQLRIYYYCVRGGLPPNLVAGLTGLESLVIQSLDASDTRGDTTCQLSGPVPAEWSATRTRIQYINLASNRLSGPLPTFQNWRLVRQIALQSNTFSGPLPEAWARLRSLQATANEFTALGGSSDYAGASIDVWSNNLDNLFPYSYKALSKALTFVDVSNNPLLKGCAPLDQFTVLDYARTGMTGKCAKSSADAEAAELEALEQLLPKLLNPMFAPNIDAWTAGMYNVLNTFAARGLRAAVPVGQDTGSQYVPISTDYDGEALEGDLSVTVSIIDGVAHVTHVDVNTVAGIDLDYLSRFVSRFPRLEGFACNYCWTVCAYPWDKQPKGGCALPPNLAASAPPSLRRLELNGLSGLNSTLPAAWGNWTTLDTLELNENKGLRGTLPASWANMATLRHLGIEVTSISGDLPSAWGTGPIAATMRELYLGSNRITGTIPFSWGGFKNAWIGLAENPMDYKKSCVPDGTYMYLGVPGVEYCSYAGGDGGQVDALAAIKKLLEASSGSAAVLPSWQTDDPGGSGIGTPPNYCRTWAGVTCDGINNVVGLKLSGLPLRAPVVLNDLAPLVLKLKKLRELDISNLKLSGQVLPEGLAVDIPLTHLNLSGNPGLSGTLPELWAGSSFLQSLDLSGCKLSGPLPPVWAALQQLRVLRLAAGRGAGAAGGLTSELPPEWGIMAALSELDVSGHPGITGSLPAAWADATAAQAAAAAAVSAAKDKAAKADAALVAAAGPSKAQSSTVAAASAVPGTTLADRLQQATDAARAAAAAKHVLAALQSAASSGVNAASAGASSLGMTALQLLRLHGCGLAGNLPASYANLQQLRVLDLSSNTGLTDTLPPEWAALSQLQELRLAGCSLSGAVPELYSRLTRLEAVDLSGNKLAGPLKPLPFTSLVSLRSLDLSRNALTGTLPALWFGLRSAEVIDVSGNALSGPAFPPAWGRLVLDAEARKLLQLRLGPGNACVEASGAAVSENSGGECVLVPDVDRADAVNKQGKCAVVSQPQPGGCGR